MNFSLRIVCFYQSSFFRIFFSVFFIIMIIQVNLREWDLEFHYGINLALVILKELKLMIIV